MPFPNDIPGYDVDPGGDAAVYDEWAAIAADTDRRPPNIGNASRRVVGLPSKRSRRP